MQLGTTQATAVERKGQEINITPLSLAGWTISSCFPAARTIALTLNATDAKGQTLDILTNGTHVVQCAQACMIMEKTTWLTHTLLMCDALVSSSSSSDVVVDKKRCEQQSVTITCQMCFLRGH